jgi:uncharacterized protein (DUF488 family)
MFSRQRAILRLLENEGGTASRLRLVKLAFLLSREMNAPKTGVYEFLPYRRGPFSFTLYHDLRTLGSDGWLIEAEHDIKVAQAPDLETAFLDRPFLDMIDGVSQRYRSMSTSAVVDRVYANHPWFTMNSEAVHKRAVTRPAAVPAVYTIGYEGIMVDGLLDLLLRAGIQRLIDVRCNPIARRYGFHKTTLKRLCEDVDVEYLHIPSLGIPSAWRADLDDPASYQRLFFRYEQEILPAQQPSVANVAKLLAEKPSAVMCMEADHTCCHRSRLAAMVSRKTALAVKELR